MSHQKKSFTSFKANESAVPDDPKDVSLAGAEAEKRESLKMVIRRVGDNCYVISGLPSAENVQENNCLQSPVVETATEEDQDDQMQSENDDAHDAVYEPRRSSPLTDSLDGELNNFNPLATETTMENGDICWEGAKNESQVDPSADIIVTLLNLLDYCISSEVTVNDVRAKIIEEVMNLMRNKDGGTGKF
ncbi:Pyridoxine/pyridoxamine 5'-phosphate oxidase [Trichinella spiralis]|uniref:Pyridoxine/pyridoxamine 5'-phosphate oxidase n=1 Tax=Trichinella spiralis TaxID=6334 RepID=A0ABR3KI43_TRISP